MGECLAPQRGRSTSEDVSGCCDCGSPRRNGSALGQEAARALCPVQAGVRQAHCERPAVNKSQCTGQPASRLPSSVRRSADKPPSRVSKLNARSNCPGGGGSNHGNCCPAPLAPGQELQDRDRPGQPSESPAASAARALTMRSLAPRRTHTPACVSHRPPCTLIGRGLRDRLNLQAIQARFRIKTQHAQPGPCPRHH